MTTLTIKSNRVNPIYARHPWVFSGAIESLPNNIKAGEIIQLVTSQDAYLATGYFGSYSQIAVRIWSYDESEEVNHEFFNKRVREAYGLRLNLINQKQTDSYRLINSENDFLPGLIVDKYSDYLCVQFHTEGIEAWRKEIIQALVEIIKPKGIFENSESLSRRVEKLDVAKKIIYGEIPDRAIIKENDLKFYVDLKEGQKTGFFLDQRDKRLALVKYVKNKSVLNCFSYTGAFSVYALSSGAKFVENVDSSGSALDLAKENIKLNKLDLKKSAFICTDAKQYLKNQPRDRFDIIILDPPAFIKDRRKIKEGQKGYRHINESAMSILPEGGILATCSCSSHLSLPDFRFIVADAGGRVKRTPRILETYTHGVDHPSLASFGEGDYLKCLYLVV